MPDLDPHSEEAHSAVSTDEGSRHGATNAWIARRCRARLRDLSVDQHGNDAIDWRVTRSSVAL